MPRVAKTTKTSKKTAKKTAAKTRSASTNHKTPEAQKARDTLDARVKDLLTKTPDLSKSVIASSLSADTNAVKASLNRLTRKGHVQSKGTTMNTVYRLTTKRRAA